MVRVTTGRVLSRMLVLCAFLLLLPRIPSGAAQFYFQTSGLAAISVSPSPHYVTTMTTNEDESVPPWFRFDLSVDYSQCFDTLEGCHMGSFVFQPPLLNLPAGAQIIDAAMFWDARYTINDLRTITATPKVPGSYTPSQVPGYTRTWYAHLTTPEFPGSGIYAMGDFGDGATNGFVNYKDAVAAALSSGTQPAAVMLDVFITYEMCGSGLCKQAGENSITVDSHTFSLTGPGGGYEFHVIYEAVPEPASWVMAGVGTILLMLYRRSR